MNPDPQSPATNRAAFFVLWLQRVFAVVLFVVGVHYWIRLVGYYDGPLWRFDLMPAAWKMAAPTLAVLYPVAGAGLWLPAPWGMVVWALIAIAETVMHVGFPEIFGSGLFRPAVHVAGLATLLGALLYVRMRRHPAGFPLRRYLLLSKIRGAGRVRSR